MENYEKLDRVIYLSLDKIDPNSETYADDVKAAKELYELKIQEDKVQNDYYIRAEEVANETERIDQDRQSQKKESKWYNQVNWTQIGTGVLASGTAISAMLISMAFQKEGYLGLNPVEIARILLNRAK